MLPEEEPRAVSPLVKKRSPKRRIDFKNDERQQSIDRQFPENSSDDGATSWADMVKNGYQRPNNSSSMHSIAKSKENSSNSLTKQKKQNDQKENSGRNTPDSSMQNSTTVSNKLNKEVSHCYTEACEMEENSNSPFSSTVAGEVPNLYKQTSTSSDKRPPSCEFSGAVVHATSMEEDEGWEVVSRSRGKPGRKGFYKIQSALSTAYSFTVTSDMSDYATEEKGLCNQNHGKSNQRNVDLDDNNEPGGHGDGNSDHSNVDSDHHHSNIDPDQHAQHHHDNNDSDCHGDGVPEDAKICHDGDNWQHQDIKAAKDNDIADKEDILQRGDSSSINNISTSRVISPDIQVSGNNHC